MKEVKKNVKCKINAPFDGGGWEGGITEVVTPQIPIFLYFKCFVSLMSFILVIYSETMHCI